MRRMMNRFLGLVAFALFPILQGCIGVLAATVLITAWSASSVIHMGTAGSAEVKFKKAELDKEVLSSIKRLAIYPGSNKDVKLAEILSDKFDIITPYEAQKALVDRSPIILMTQQEKVRHMCGLCDTLKADGILFYSETGYGSDMKFISFKRAETTTEFSVEVFSRGKVVWVQEGEIVWKAGGTTPEQGEIDKVVASAVAERFLDAFKLGLQKPDK